MGKGVWRKWIVLERLPFRRCNSTLILAIFVVAVCETSLWEAIMGVGFEDELLGPWLA
jgi:hypothetical protein